MLRCERHLRADPVEKEIAVSSHTDGVVNSPRGRSVTPESSNDKGGRSGLLRITTVIMWEKLLLREDLG